MTQEALNLALEVNESMKDVLKQVNELIAENKALKEALAQTQEPVAWMYQEYRDDDQFGWRDEILFTPPPNDPIYFRNITPVYTATPQRTEQEPVALPCCGYADSSAIKWNPYSQVVQCHNCGQVYTTPPQRTWVGLTKEQLATTDWSADFRAGALWAEAKLKQKNGYAEEENI